MCFHGGEKKEWAESLELQDVEKGKKTPTYQFLSFLKLPFFCAGVTNWVMFHMG